MSTDLPGPFLAGLDQLGLHASEQQLAQLLCYREELLEWNRRINLTAITDADEVLVKHFLDALSLLTVYHVPQASVLDLGSGAGFPGLPLKIMCPQWHVTLLEATGKKVHFLRHMVETLQLNHVEVLQGRAEELAHQVSYRGTFDMVTARAVAALSPLLECSAAYCRINGYMILPKKGDITEELRQGMRTAEYVGATLQEAVPVELPQLADGRCLYVWRQRRPCPPQFPRAWSTMIRKSLP